jgi:hypothetical protein
VSKPLHQQLLEKSGRVPSEPETAEARSHRETAHPFVVALVTVSLLALLALEVLGQLKLVPGRIAALVPLIFLLIGVLGWLSRADEDEEKE